MSVYGQVGEVGANLARPHFAGVAHVVEANEIGNVLFVLIFGVDAVMQDAHDLSHLIEQARRVGYANGFRVDAGHFEISRKALRTSDRCCYSADETDVLLVVWRVLWL